MGKRKFWVSQDRLLKKPFGRQSVVIAQLREAKRVKPRSVVVGGQGSKHAGLVSFRHATNPQPVPELNPSPRNQLKDVLAATDLRDFCENFPGLGTLQAHIDRHLSPLRSTDAGVG